MPRGGTQRSVIRATIPLIGQQIHVLRQNHNPRDLLMLDRRLPEFVGQGDEGCR